MNQIRLLIRRFFDWLGEENAHLESPLENERGEWIVHDHY